VYTLAARRFLAMHPGAHHPGRAETNP
jgi:hypothetical protein